MKRDDDLNDAATLAPSTQVLPTQVLPSQVLPSRALAIDFPRFRQQLRSLFPHLAFEFLTTAELAAVVAASDAGPASVFWWDNESSVLALPETWVGLYARTGWLNGRIAGIKKSSVLSLSITPMPFHAALKANLEALAASPERETILADAERVVGQLRGLLLQQRDMLAYAEASVPLGRKSAARVMILANGETPTELMSPTDLILRAREHHPGAQIVCRIPSQPAYAEAHDTWVAACTHLDCPYIVEDIPMGAALETVDSVFTHDAADALEALLLEMPVVTTGRPFYAGRGLTEDLAVETGFSSTLTELMAALTMGDTTRYFGAQAAAEIQLEAGLAQLAQIQADAPQKDPNQVYGLIPEDAAPSAVVGGRPTHVHVMGDAPWLPLLSSWFEDLTFDIPEQIASRKLTKPEFNADLKPFWDMSPTAQIFVVNGRAPSFMRKYAEETGKPIVHVSTGFLRSRGLGLGHTPPFSLLVDRQAPHYDARRATDLEDLLSAYDFAGDVSLMKRAATLRQQFVDSRLSKYNHATAAPDLEAIYGPKDRKRVLVLGQNEHTEAFRLSNQRSYTNADLVQIAALENPGAQILFKPHPEIASGLIPPVSDLSMVAHLCQVLDHDLPLYQALETVDQVYTVSSLGGFEARLRGIPTTVMGLPFYAGWGLGDDRQSSPRRTRSLSVDEVFAAAYVLYPLYVDPLYKSQIDLERAMARLQSELGSDLVEVSDAEAPAEPAPLLTVVVGDPSYRALLPELFPDRRFVQLGAKVTQEEFGQKFKRDLDRNPTAEIFVKGTSLPVFLRRYLQSNPRQITYMSDGFLLGAGRTLPFAFVLDRQSPHFDARQPSDLEDLLNHHDFAGDTDLMMQAKSRLATFLSNGLSQYNQSAPVADLEAIYGPKDRKRILVIGQNEAAEASRLSNPRNYANTDLVEIAALENPGAQIIFKPHPDVLSKRVAPVSNMARVRHLCDILVDDLPLPQALETIDQVYIISSLGGFEALLRHVPTTVLGTPFYAGWGLSDDRQATPRRLRRLSVEELFAAAYLLYPVYVDPLYKTRIDLGKAMARIQADAAAKAVVAPIEPDTVEPAQIATYVVGDPGYRTLLPYLFPQRTFGHMGAKVTPDEFTQKFKKELDQRKGAELFVSGVNVPVFLRRYLQASPRPLVYVTDGFLQGARKTLPLSLVQDRQAPHYDSRRATDLEDLLNSHDFEADDDLLPRAARLRQQWLDSGLSKLNQAVTVESLEAVYGEKTRRRVLVLGQVEDAEAFRLSNPRNYSNNDMVEIAALENPGAQIIFKPHPDILAKRVVASSNVNRVRHLCDVLAVDLPLTQALETVDQVYTISSLGGFEARLRGLPVTVLGLPFYAGWGTGDDRQPCERRTRTLSIDAVFAAAYILYSTYADPLYKARIDLGTAIERASEAPVASETTVAVALKPAPAELWAKFERYGDWSDETKPVAFAFSFTSWRYSQIATYIPDYRIAFLNVPPGEREKTNLKPFYPVFNSVHRPSFIVLGIKNPPGMMEYAAQNGTEILRVEDGFIRGVGLGAELSPPLSLTIDRTGMYFDARTPSDLENILSTYDFDGDPGLIKEAERCIKVINTSRATKYNITGSMADQIYGSKTRKRILVIGQVESDASILFGCDRKIDNNGLVMLAAVENPDAEIIYKPHPDVIRGNRKFSSNPKDVEGISTVIYAPMGIHDALDTIDHVYTVTSLAGFEALLRGIPVTTFGAPFYAGWGATDTRQLAPRRQRTLTTAQIFAGAYLLYMHYRHPITGAKIGLGEVLTVLGWMRDKRMSLQPKFVTDAEVARSHYKIAQRRQAERQFDEAYDELSSAVRLDPENYVYPLTKAKLLIEKGELSERTKDDMRLAVEVAGKTNYNPVRTLISYLWSHEGINKELLDLADRLLNEPKDNDAKTLVWLAAIYAEAGHTDRAVDLYLDAHKKSPAQTERFRYLNLLKEVGLLYPEKINNYNRVRAAVRHVEQYQSTLETFVRDGRKIAVVGNSPCEIGLGKGGLIDSHDLVLRFNNFSTGFPHRADYGSRTNIWVKTGFNETVRKRNMSEFDLVIQSASHLLSMSAMGVNLITSAMADGGRMAMLPTHYRYELVRRLQAPPSAGLLILYWLFNINGLSRDSVFGFSFTDQPPGGHTSYHSPSDGGMYKHNWAAEREIFDSLFN